MNIRVTGRFTVVDAPTPRSPEPARVWVNCPEQGLHALLRAFSLDVSYVEPDGDWRYYEINAPLWVYTLGAALLRAGLTAVPLSAMQQQDDYRSCGEE